MNYPISELAIMALRCTTPRDAVLRIVIRESLRQPTPRGVYAWAMSGESVPLAEAIRNRLKEPPDAGDAGAIMDMAGRIIQAVRLAEDVSDSKLFPPANRRDEITAAVKEAIGEHVAENNIELRDVDATAEEIVRAIFGEVSAGNLGDDPFSASHRQRPVSFSATATPTAAPSVAPSARRRQIAASPAAHRYRKELIRDGLWSKEADGIQFLVTPEARKQWVETFSRMKANGVRVPIVKAHTDPDGRPYTSDDADASRGWLVDMLSEGDRLIGIVDLIGDDAQRLALSNDVSIYVPPSFVDGHGNRYLRPIMHVALTSFPAIPGMGPFEAIAASRGPSPVVLNVRRPVASCVRLLPHDMTIVLVASSSPAVRVSR